jgi:excisionase family DNA binding protein
MSTHRTIKLLARIDRRLAAITRFLYERSQEYVSVSQAAAFTGLSVKQLRRAIHARTLPAVNVGNGKRPTWRIARSDLTNWMETRERGEADLPPSATAHMFERQNQKDHFRR